MTAKLRQHSLSSVRKLQELLHECNVQLATFRSVIQGIGVAGDGPQLRKEIDNSARACIRSCEATKNCVLPQLKHEDFDQLTGVEFTRHASQFIACVSSCVVEMKRCEALESTFPFSDASTTSPHIANMEVMLETLENLITVHYSTSEAAPQDKVAPRRRRGATCRPQCVCSKLKTSYA
uniref:CX9C domain-containing protein n=1 Tax=Panagrellus redivivus TaxID=6233 RepID=A0A7E4V3M0_PANRE